MSIEDRTEAEVAWAAGLFEGEGCVHVWPSPKRGGILVMNMTDEDVMRRFHAIVEVGTITGPIAGQQANHKPHWQWRAARWTEIEPILHTLYPFMGERRRAKIDKLYEQFVWEILASNPLRDFCKRGHALEGADADVRVFWYKGKRHRQCRPCRRLLAAEERGAA